MSISDGSPSSKAVWRRWKWPEWTILALTGTLCLGLGMVVGKENAAGRSTDDRLWIEQLPASELAGAISSTTPISAVPVGQVGMPKGNGTQQAVAAAAAPTPTTAVSSVAHNFVASKTGTKYYTPDCAAAKRIKDENKVWFATKQAAETAGLTPSTSCKGL